MVRWIVPVWLLVQAQLSFNPKLKTIYPKRYAADLLPESGRQHYGVHLVSQDTKIEPGEEVTAELLVRAYPKDACEELQPGKVVALKEGSLTRAEGRIIRRREYNSNSCTVSQLLQELATDI
jgi:hypothetical protein